MASGAPIVVEASGLTRRFGRVTAVDRMSLAIGRGEIFGLVGPDGAGKTTTLRLLCGLLEPSGGRVRVAGYDVGRDPFAVRDRIGYMALRFGLYADRTVMENMRLYADLFGLKRAVQAPLEERLLEMTRMAPFRHRAAGKLSGGMKQKLALMCTLLHKPEILFLDEPTNGVDPVSRRDFWAILYRLVQEGMTVCITTSYLDEAERCNRVGLVYQGRIVLCAPPGELRSGIAEPCYRVVAPDLRACLGRLRSLPWVVSAAPAGAALHLFLSPDGASEERIRADLEGEGLGPVDVERIRPSLEDAFINLMGKTGADGARGAAQQ